MQRLMAGDRRDRVGELLRARRDLDDETELVRPDLLHRLERAHNAILAVDPDADDVVAGLIDDVHPAEERQKVVGAKRQEGNLVGGDQAVVTVMRRSHGDLQELFRPG